MFLSYYHTERLCLECILRGAGDEAAPLFYQLSEIIWPLAIEVHLLLGNRMHEAEGLGMESLTWAELEAILYESLIAAAALTSQNLCSTVCLVHEERMADVFHVGTYLVGSACLQDALHEGGIAESLQHLVVGNGSLANATIRVEHLHAEAILRVATDIALDASLILHDIAPYQSIVTAMGGLIEELLA